MFSFLESIIKSVYMMSPSALQSSFTSLALCHRHKRYIFLSSTNISPWLSCLLVGGCDSKAIKISNKTIRKIYDKISYPLLSFLEFYCSSFLKGHHKFSKYLKLPINPKAKEIQFKSLNGVYPLSQFLCLWLGSETKEGVLSNDIETFLYKSPY